MWKKILGYNVFIENGMILRALKDDGQTAASVYRWDQTLKYWTDIYPCSIPAFRAGIRRGTYSIM